MHNYYFLLRLLCWAVLFLGAPTTSNFANTLVAEAPIPPNCNLPAPTDLSVTGITANSISIAWNPVAGANGYATEFVETATGNVAFALNVAGTNVTATPLQSGTKYRFTVRAICPNGTVSGKAGRGEAATQFIIVDDLVASFPINPEPINNCTTFPVGNEVKLMAVGEGSEGGGEFKVTIGGDNNDNLLVVHPNIPNPNFERNWVFTNETNVTPFHSFTTAKEVRVFYGPGATQAEIVGNADNLKMTFKVERVGPSLSQIHFCPLYLAANYSIHAENLSGNKPGHNTTSTSAALQSTLSLSPNPFNEVLNLQLDKGAGASANITLMDMQGRALLTQNIEAGTQNITIPTADLLPGIYMVRYETKTGINTYKVLKTNY